MHNDLKADTLADILVDHRAMTREQVGGKFHNQALMRQQGINVPEFFCLSSTLFQRVVQPEQARIAEVLRELDAHDRKAVQQAAQRLHALMHELVIDPATQAAINRALYKHLPDTQLVSVRACMVSQQAEFSEDSASNPFAGISESFLYVRPADVLARVRDCWASAFAEKALLYRLSQGIDPLDVSVVVGVQRMVFGERSFVMFTCDPNTAARDTLLVAGYGIGEGVVQESVPVDHYFVNAKSGAIEHVLADKQTMLTFDAEAGFGLRESPVYEQYHAPACLNDDEIKALRELGQRIEKVFGWPQDIEGTVDAQGRVHILQARPVSIDFTHKRLWTGLNVTESYPGVSSPLTYTLARLFYRVIFRDIYKRAGASDAQLTDNHHRLDSMIGYVNGRIYYSLNSFYLLHGMVPIFPLLCKAWENMVGLKTSYFIASGEAPQPVGKWRHRWNVARAMGTFVTEFVRLPQRMRGYKTWWQGRAKQARHVLKTERDALALSEEFHRLWRDVGQQWGVTLINDAYIFSLFAIVGGLFKRWKLDTDPALLSNLLCGDDEIESVEVFMSVLRIAEHIRCNEALACNFLDSDDAVLVARYRTRQFDSALLSLLDHHIARFGDRSMEELKVENPSLREDPTVLLRGIKRFIKSDLNVDACRRAELDKRAQGEQALDARFGNWSPRKALLRWMLKLLREVIAHRENSRYCRSELFGICRDIFYAQAEHLVAKGAIDQPADVCYLTVDEITGYANGTGVDESFQSTVARRREQLQVYASQDVPETLATNGALRNNVLTRDKPVPGAAGSSLSGLGSSMGVARGRARVVLDPNAVEDLPPDSILVTRETDPGWLFLMLASAGIVVERGSMLSHTAITGRKFGIPTVVGVDDACSRIPDGAPLEINGGSGVVKLLGEGL